MFGRKLSLVYSMIYVVSALNSSVPPKGCNLVTPRRVREHIEPESESGPLLLHIELSVLHIREIPDSGGSFGVDVWMWLSWLDKRYLAENDHRASECKSNIVLWQERNQYWLPTIMVPDALEVRGYLEDPDRPGALGWRYLTYEMDSGLFTLWASSYARIYCKMDFTLYPFDRQKCNFIISLIKNTKFQKFQTKINASKISNGNESIFQAKTEMFRFSVHPLDFEIVDGQLSKWSEMKGNYEVKQHHFSVSGFVLDLERLPTPYLTNIYFPSGLLTIISFIGFVIPVDIVPGRMALLVTIFLMLVNTSSTERNRGPKTTSVTALDTWFNICIIFVTTAMFEYATLLQIKYGTQSNESAEKQNEEDNKVMKKCQTIDFYALRVYIASYILTVVSYFYIYMYVLT